MAIGVKLHPENEGSETFRKFGNLRHFTRRHNPEANGRRESSS
jgi:hypothetical protein